MRGQRLGLRRGDPLSEPALAEEERRGLPAAPAAAPLTVGVALRQWWPLAGGWLLMTAELTVFAAIVARMPDPTVQLAAWGVVFAVSTLVQAPSTALLPSATALARDRRTFATLARYGGGLVAALTALHALVALTPLYDVVVRGAMGVPEPVAAAARVALVVMLPWTFGTGARRFLQGVMIRFGHARVVITGAVLRLGLGTGVMLVGSANGWLPGAQLAAVAIIVGVLGELGYNLLRFALAMPGRLPARDLRAEALTLARFASFYAPLVLMTVLTMFVQTLVTVVLGRMPLPLESLAVWPVLFSLLVILQSPALAYTEVVISLLERPGAAGLLGRVTRAAAAALTLLLVAVVATPLARAWFGGVAGLTGALVDLAVVGLWLGLAVPGLRLLTSWYQGVIIHGQRTRAILESVLVFLVTGAVLLGAGVLWGGVTGLYVGMVALTAAMLAQAAWLAHRAGPLLAAARSAGAARSEGAAAR